MLFFVEVGGDGVESFEDLLTDSGRGDFFFEDLGDPRDENGDLAEGDDVGRSGGVVFGESAFEGPSGSTPVLGFPGGIVEQAEVVELGLPSGLLEAFSEFGVELGFAADGRGRAVDELGGAGETAAELEGFDHQVLFGLVLEEAGFSLGDHDGVVGVREQGVEKSKHECRNPKQIRSTK